MGTVAEKLTYLNGTKSSLKTAINNLGGDITSSTTFRNYANVLNDIYDNLPKVSDTGTNVSLSPTLKGRLGIVPKGNTYQESTTGKNVLNPFVNYSAGYTTTKNGITYTLNKDGTITANGTATSDATLILFGAWSGTTAYGTLDTTKTYKVSGGTLDGTKKVFIRTRTDGTYATYNDSSQNTITNQSELVYFAVNVVSGTTVNNYVFEPMIAIESSDTSYEPYTGGQPSPSPDYPQEIQSATGTQKVVVSGKNKLPNEQTTQTINGITFTVNNDKSITLNGTSTAVTDLYLVGSASQYANLELNTDTYNFNGCSGGSGTTYMLYMVQNKNGTLNYYRSFTSTGENISIENSDTFRIFIRVMSGQTVNNVTIYPQLEQGNTSTPYQPYQEPQEVDIELGNIELNKIGDYEDYIGGTPDNWVLYKNIGKKAPNLTSSSVANLYMDNTTFNKQYKIQQAYSNCFQNVINTNITDNNTAGNLLNENQFSFRWGNENARDRLYIKSSLTLAQIQSLNIELLYVLATGTTETITEEPLVSQLNELYYLQSYNDTTNIDVTGNLPMRITASAIKGA